MYKIKVTTALGTYGTSNVMAYYKTKNGYKLTRAYGLSDEPGSDNDLTFYTTELSDRVVHYFVDILALLGVMSYHESGNSFEFADKLVDVLIEHKPEVVTNNLIESSILPRYYI